MCGVPIHHSIGKVVSVAPKRVGVGVSFVPLAISILLGKGAAEKGEDKKQRAHGSSLGSSWRSCKARACLSG